MEPYPEWFFWSLGKFQIIVNSSFIFISLSLSSFLPFFISFFFSLFFLSFFYFLFQLHGHNHLTNPKHASCRSLCLLKIVFRIFSRVHATLQPALSVGWSVGQSVGWLVGRSHFTFFHDFIFLTSLLLPKWSSDLKYGPCPPAHDFGSRASGIVFSIFVAELCSTLVWIFFSRLSV